MNTILKIAGLAAPLAALTVLGAMPAQAQSSYYDGPVYQDYPSTYQTQGYASQGYASQSVSGQGYYDQGSSGYYDQGYDRNYQSNQGSSSDGWVGLAVGAIAGALIVGALTDDDDHHYRRDRDHRGRDYRDRDHRRDDHRRDRHDRRW